MHFSVAGVAAPVVMIVPDYLYADLAKEVEQKRLELRSAFEALRALKAQ